MSRSADFRASYGPWALVTGASSGIGEQFARQLARRGLNVLLVARRRERLAALAGELTRRRGPQAEVIAVDLGEATAVDQVLAAVADRDIGLVVSNAGFGLKGAFGSASRATLESMFNVNARTPLLLLHELLPRLRARTKAGIILTGSQEGEAPFPWSAAYAATKAFVHSLGLDLYGELPPDIRSAWLFALRKGFSHPPEYHPNSIQRMFALNRTGQFEVWNGERWIRHELAPGQGLSIPAGSWHRAPALDEHWVVASFHTAKAAELIEIVGDPASGKVGSSRVYLSDS